MTCAGVFMISAPRLSKGYHGSAMEEDESELEPELAGLLRLFELTRIDDAHFEGDPGPGEGRLFGGMVAAQSVVAAGRTVESGQIHSLHAYFLRPGRHDVPLWFEVDRIRDGRTFTTRRVVARQGGEAIFNLSASFTQPEESIEHQDPAPEAPDPMDPSLMDWESMRALLHDNPKLAKIKSPIEVKVCDTETPGEPQPARRRVWMRPRGPIPDDPVLHAGVLVYASDRTFLGTAARPHNAWRDVVPASLDHAVWFHHPPRFDDWLLYASHSPVAHNARAIILGGLFTRAGVRVASVAQEGLIRLRSQKKPK